MKKFLYLISAGLLILFIAQGCAKTEGNKYGFTNHGVDDALYADISNQTFTAYYGDESIQPAYGESPHESGILKFNTTAQAALGDNGKLPTGQSFPQGSILLKEVYNNAGKLVKYVVMKKEAYSEYSNKDWLWAEYDDKGDLLYGTFYQGTECISCHSITPNRDYSRSFDLY
jgi:hypothetical protein